MPTTAPLRIDIWSDVVCPFCYIGKKRLEHVAREAGITLDIHWHSYELDPNAPAKHDSNNTQRLAEKYGRTIEQTEDMQRNIANMARDEGIDFNWQKAQSGNSFNAHRIVHLAKRTGLADQAKEAFFYAYMTEGLPIGERATVELIAQRIGLAADDVNTVLNSDQFEEHVRRDEEIAQSQLEITGVPFFVLNGKIGLSGAQPREVFLDALHAARSDDSATTPSNATDDTAQCDMPST